MFVSSDFVLHCLFSFLQYLTCFDRTCGLPLYQKLLTHIPEIMCSSHREFSIVFMVSKHYKGRVQDAEFEEDFDLNFLVITSFENSPNQSFISNNIVDVRKSLQFKRKLK